MTGFVGCQCAEAVFWIAVIVVVPFKLAGSHFVCPCFLHHGSSESLFVDFVIISVVEIADPDFLLQLGFAVAFAEFVYQAVVEFIKEYIPVQIDERHPMLVRVFL